MGPQSILHSIAKTTSPAASISATWLSQKIANAASSSSVFGGRLWPVNTHAIRLTAAAIPSSSVTPGGVPFSEESPYFVSKSQTRNHLLSFFSYLHTFLRLSCH